MVFWAMARQAWQYLWARPLTAALNLLLLTLALATVTVVLQVSRQLDQAFERDVAGIDVVVGAKGSPLQLILAGVFHLDAPSGNIPLVAAQALARHPQVAKMIPLSLGDSHRGFRVVGTSPDYLALYQAQTARGALWSQPLQAVVGAQVAQATGLKPGDSFAGSHGLGAQGSAHGNHPYQVSGVLAPCACVLDRLIVTSTESVWQVHDVHPAMPASKAKSGSGDHDDHDDHDDQKGHQHHGAELNADDKREITMALLQYRSPMAAMSFPRFINTTTALQAAAPALEITRLLRMVGVGTDVLKGFGVVLLITAALSVFIALWSAVRERRADLAMLRMLGASPGKLAGLLWFEALWLAVLASLLGLLLGHGLVAVIGLWLAAERSVPLSGLVWLAEEAWVPASAVLVATIAALIPAVSAYRVDVAELLNAR